MSEPSTEEILAAYREQNRLPAATRARALDGIAARIDAGSSPAPDLELNRPGATAGWAGKAMVGVALLGLVGAAVWSAGGEEHEVREGPPVAAMVEEDPGEESSPAPTPPPPEEPPELEDPLPPPEPGPMPAPAVTEAREVPTDSERPRAASPRPRDPEETFDQEMRLLKSAQTALRGGDAKSALAKLELHARRYPGSKLADARSVSLLLALCDLGDVARLERERKRFLSAHPDSPHAARARGVCKELPAEKK